MSQASANPASRPLSIALLVQALKVILFLNAPYAA